MTVVGDHSVCSCELRVLLNVLQSHPVPLEAVARCFKEALDLVPRQSLFLCQEFHATSHGDSYSPKRPDS